MACEIKDPTNNLICSDSLKDLKDNAVIMDQLVNSEEFIVPDRLGIPRKTWAGLEKDVQENIDGIEDLINDKVIASGGVIIEQKLGNNKKSVVSQKVTTDGIMEAKDTAGNITNNIIDQRKNELNAIADKAISASNSAFVSANVYQSIQEGVSSTDANDQFQVLSSDGFYYDRYLNQNGDNAILIAKIPTGKYIESFNTRLRNDIPRQFAQMNESVVDGVIFSVSDNLGNRTWLEVTKFDGGLSDLSKRYIDRKMKVSFQTFEGDNDVIFSVTDGSGVSTDLCVGRDGRFPNFVIESIAQRMNINASYGLGLFGSSTFQDMHPFINEVYKNTNVTNVFLGGDSGSTVESISARIGSNNPSLKFSSPIHSGENSTIANWFIDAGMKSWVAELSNGVKGSVSYKNSQYLFTPSNIEENIEIDNEYEYKITPKDVLNQFVFIINAGKNNLSSGNSNINNPEYVFQETVQITDFLDIHNKKYMVVGHFVNTDQLAAQEERVNLENEKLKKRYGLLYFDLQKYLSSDQVWIDTGITPTADDLSYQEINRLAPSLSRNAGHMNPVTSRAACERMKDQLIKLNYVEVK